MRGTYYIDMSYEIRREEVELNGKGLRMPQSADSFGKMACGLQVFWKDSSQSSLWGSALTPLARKVSTVDSNLVIYHFSNEFIT